jgi:polar amino acid transport system substrate-binding protein
MSIATGRIGRLAAAAAIAASFAALVLMFILTPWSAALAQGSGQQKLRVVTRVLPPVVMEQPGGKLSGFSIELWERIAEKLKLAMTFHVAPNVGALLADVRAGKADVGVAAISITSAREAEFDFTQPILNAGLQIMVRGRGPDDGSNPLGDLLGLLLSPAILVWLGIAMLLIIIPAHIVWYLERDCPGGIIPTDKYYPGIFYALYWAATTLATQAEQAPRQWLARLVTVLWMFVGVVFVAFYTAQLAATLTVQQIQGGINGPNDLPGKMVATTAGSTAAAAARALRADVVEVGRIEDAYKALNDKQVDAVVFDAPVLLYYAARAGKGRVQLVGAPFRKEDYGIVFPRNSALRKQVNVALLALREDGTYQTLYDKWFTSK